MSYSIPKFTGRNAPIKEIAKATGKDPQYIRICILMGMKFIISSLIIPT